MHATGSEMLPHPLACPVQLCHRACATLPPGCWTRWKGWWRTAVTGPAHSIPSSSTRPLIPGTLQVPKDCKVWNSSGFLSSPFFEGDDGKQLSLFYNKAGKDGNKRIRFEFLFLDSLLFESPTLALKLEPWVWGTRVSIEALPSCTAAWRGKRLSGSGASCKRAIVHRRHKPLGKGPRCGELGPTETSNFTFCATGPQKRN